MKILLMHDVSAIGLKLVGVDGLSMAELFPSSFIPVVFHARGMVLVAQQQLKRSMRAAVRSGHLLNTWYGTWSKGEGEEPDLEHLTTASISSATNMSVTNSVVGG